MVATNTIGTLSFPSAPTKRVVGRALGQVGGGLATILLCGGYSVAEKTFPYGGEYMMIFGSKLKHICPSLLLNRA